MSKPALDQSAVQGRWIQPQQLQQLQQSRNLAARITALYALGRICETICETLPDCFNFRVQPLAATVWTLHIEVTLADDMTRLETRISLISAPKTARSFGACKLLPA